MLQPTFQLGPVVLSTFGLWCGLSLMAVAWVGRVEFHRRSIARKHLAIFVIAVTPIAAAGASLAHALDFGGWSVLSYWFYAPAVYPGASFLGGALPCWMAALVYARVVFGPATQARVFLDALAPLILLTYGLGRVGCHLAGHGTCCGGQTDAWYGVCYPHSVGSMLPVIPMALVEAALTLLLFSWLWRGRARHSSPGAVFAWHVILLGAERLCVEPWRLNPRHALGLTQAQWISAPLVIVGCAWLWWTSRGRTAADRPDESRSLVHR